MNYKNVLLIDDSDVDRYLLRRQVKKIHIADVIHEAEHGLEAIDLLKQLGTSSSDPEPVLIFVDINMPIMNGFEFLAALTELLKEIERLKDTNVIVISSSDSQEDKTKAREHSLVSGYLTKACETADEFKTRIEELVH